ncbi:MAG: DUF177 domain-containing protein [Thermoanaerobaculia bacterium]
MRKSIPFDDVDQLGPQHVAGKVDVTAEELDCEEVRRIGEVDVDVTVQKGDIPAEYLVEGSVRFDGELNCARCLGGMPFANDSGFAVRYRPRSSEEVQEEEEHEIHEEELDVEYYDERAVSIHDLAAEQIQLSIPMKPLCDENCRGLCPQCGADLNREKCECSTESTDARWDALREIREKLNESK